MNLDYCNNIRIVPHYYIWGAVCIQLVELFEYIKSHEEHGIMKGTTF